MMLVAQCASLRLMRVLGILGPHDKMTAEVVQKFMAKFKTPLMEEEMIFWDLKKTENNIFQPGACAPKLTQ